MKLAMQVTLEGMIRALRMKARELGDDGDEALRQAKQRNETALTLLSEESRRFRLETGDEFGS
ncbi:MAG: hypothetical protein KF810_05355 [Rhizobiaceae bacterium]|nr:hypothetical protein [Rhizobiaceae bacterium]